MSSLAKRLQSLDQATDTYFKNTALLVHADGTNGAQNNTFIDSSTNNFTVTRGGDATQGTFTPFSLPEGQWSNSFDGTGDYIDVVGSSGNAAFNFGSGNVTIECWVYHNSITGYQNYYRTQGTGANAAYIFRNNGGQLEWWVFDAVGNAQITALSAAGAITTNRWYHVAMVRNGSSNKIYVNGVASGTEVIASYTAVAPQQNIGIGRGASPDELMVGYISNLRVVKGTAVYTSNFTVPTSLTAISGTSLLTCRSNRIKDYSSNNWGLTVNGDAKPSVVTPFTPTSAYNPAVNGGSLYLDGTGDYLSIASNAAFTFGTGDFTVECWINFSDVSGTARTIVRQRANATTSWNLQLNSGAMYFYYGTSALTDGAAVPINTWIHYAAVKNAGVMTLYKNGVAIASVSNNFNFSSTDAVLVGIGGDSDDAAYASIGYIADVRIVKGTALYTSSFTPPDAPLTAITNTQLLLNFTNAAMYDNAKKHYLTTVGTAQISTSVKKYGTGSIYLNGSSYALLHSTPEVNFGTGDFTIECWIYATSIVTDAGSIVAGIGPTNGDWMFALLSSTSLSFGRNQVAWDLATSGFTFSTNTWYHVAACRSGTTMKIFVNGTAYVTATNTQSYNIVNQTYAIGGRQASPGSGTVGQFFTGYIDDVRITKDVARYTSDFTAPTAALPNR